MDVIKTRKFFNNIEDYESIENIEKDNPQIWSNDNF